MNYWETETPCQSPVGILDWLLSLLGVNLFSASDPQTFYCRTLLSFTHRMPGGDSLVNYLYFFGTTVLFEIGFYIAATRMAGARRGWAYSHPVLFCLIANIATHPIVYLLMPDLGLWAEMREGWLVLASEGFAITVETGIIYVLARPRVREAFAFALLANLVSWGLGPFFLMDLIT